MLYLGWIVAAFLGGMLLAGWLLLRRKQASLKQRFSEMDTFMGRSYAQVLAIAQTPPQSTSRRANGQAIRTWCDGDYTLALLFDAQDICLGVEDESLHGREDRERTRARLIGR